MCRLIKVPPNSRNVERLRRAPPEENSNFIIEFNIYQTLAVDVHIYITPFSISSRDIIIAAVQVNCSVYAVF